jgi:hypothetical protein
MAEFRNPAGYQPTSACRKPLKSQPVRTLPTPLAASLIVFGLPRSISAAVSMTVLASNRNRSCVLQSDNDIGIWKSYAFFRLDIIKHCNTVSLA